MSDQSDTIDDASPNRRQDTPSPILDQPAETSGQPSPHQPYPYKIRLYQMGDNEMEDLAGLVNITLSGNLSNKRSQIEKFFSENRPKQARTEKGHLLFDCTFDPKKPRKIGALTSLELQAVMESTTYQNRLFSIGIENHCKSTSRNNG